MTVRRALTGCLLLPSLWACSPELGDTPYSCLENPLCPEGYACESGVCVREGTGLGNARPMRVHWINAAEMYWFPGLTGGATLVVNDGFSPGRHGVYELTVEPSGRVSAPRTLLDLGDEFPTASAVVAIDDRRYAVVTLRFPRIDEPNMVLAVQAIEREAPDSIPVVETLYTEQVSYLGGAEPPYIGAVVRDRDTLDIAFVDPSLGGRVQLVRVVRDGAVWVAARRTEIALPEEIPPLSGDCLLWPRSDGGLWLRAGLESIFVSAIDAEGTASELVETEGLPVYAFDDSLFELDVDEGAAGLSASYALRTIDGEELGSDPAGAFQEGLEPYTATPFGSGVLVAPIGDDEDFSVLHVGYRSPTTPLTRVAAVERLGDDGLYSARAFGVDGQAYVAFTTFHESLMDLWVAVAPLEGVGP